METKKLPKKHIETDKKKNDFCLDRRNGDQKVTKKHIETDKNNDFCLDRRNGDQKVIEKAH